MEVASTNSEPPIIGTSDDGEPADESVWRTSTSREYPEGSDRGLDRERFVDSIATMRRIIARWLG